MDVQNDYEYDNDYENDYANDDYYDDDQNYDLDLYAKKSETKEHYAMCSSEKIYTQIDKQIQEIMDMTCLSYGWVFQLYSVCHWQKAPIYKLMDINSSFKKVIHYHPGYFPSQTKKKQLCEVCYEEERLLNNCCSHKYCQKCWVQLLEASVFLNSELMPKCQGQDCQELMNYDLISYCLKFPENKNLGTSFDRLKVLLYSRGNSSVKVCPNPQCQNKFLIFDLVLKPIWCSCGYLICTYCGEQHHFPIDCAQRENWNKITEQLEKKWIQAVRYKICPSCKNPIQKNEGCNHMTCRCRHQFCWICLKNWKTHGTCMGMDAHEKMEAQRQKMLRDKKQYRQKFYSARQQFERFENYEKRIRNERPQQMKQGLMNCLQISVQQTYFLSDLKNHVTIGAIFCKYCVIYGFFRGDTGDKIFEMYSKRIEKQIDELDEYLTNVKKNYEIFIKQQNYDPDMDKIKEQAKNRLADLLSSSTRKDMIEKQSRSQEFLLKLIQRK